MKYLVALGLIFAGCEPRYNVAVYETDQEFWRRMAFYERNPAEKQARMEELGIFVIEVSP